MPLPIEKNSDLILVIDQGSHASRIALFSISGELIYLKSQQVSTQSNAQTGTYEQDGNEILRSIQKLLNHIPNEFTKRIRCCGLSTQRSTVLAWHKTTGQVLSPAISWRDTRAQVAIEQLSASAIHIQKISGLPLSAHYSASKIHWLLNNNNNAKQAQQENQLCISPLASFLLFNLLNEKPLIIDHSNAQRCQLFDIHSLNWSATLLDLFQVDKNVLPACAPVMHDYGTLCYHNIAVTAVCGDQNAVFYAEPNLPASSALINVGTGAFILSTLAEKQSQNPQQQAALICTLASSSAKQADFITEGTVNGAGSALDWAQLKDPCENLFKKLPLWLQQIQQPPIFINCISGLGSPWWSTAGEATFTGKNKLSQAERYVAIIESIVFLIFNNIQHLTSLPESLYISGGLSQLDGLCQKLANLSHIKVQRFTSTETTIRGCAWLSQQNLKSHSNWQPLGISQTFMSTKKTSQHKNLLDRYQRFVGELNKRCNND